MMADIAANEYLEYGKSMLSYFYCLTLSNKNDNTLHVGFIQNFKESLNSTLLTV